MSLDSEIRKFSEFSDLCDQKVRIELNKFSRSYCVIYDFPIIIPKIGNNPEFIPNFLEQHSYTIVEEKAGQKFEHSRQYLNLHAKSREDDSFKIFVKLNTKFGGYSNVNYQGPDLSRLSIANDLVNEILKNYIQQ